MVHGGIGQGGIRHSTLLTCCSALLLCLVAAALPLRCSATHISLLHILHIVTMHVYIFTAYDKAGYAYHATSPSHSKRIVAQRSTSSTEHVYNFSTQLHVRE
jgi:hypothetical protein